MSDSGNNRLLIVDPTTRKVLHTIGSGNRGANDGNFNTASFNNPQGITAIGDEILLIADTDNHLLRRVDVTNKTVLTVGGTGKAFNVLSFSLSERVDDLVRIFSFSSIITSKMF